MSYRDPSSLVICLKGMTRGTGTGINLLCIDYYYRGRIPRAVVPFLVIDIALLLRWEREVWPLVTGGDRYRVYINAGTRMGLPHHFHMLLEHVCMWTERQLFRSSSRRMAF